ncbi:MAG: CapA family protein [Thermoleophilia bacterium]|nr:CapA family protein [Thermoleophilia bacterium]
MSRIAGGCEVMKVRNALKALGAALVVIALCLPLMFLPADNARTSGTQVWQATVTVPPTVVVTTTMPPSETTTTTTLVTAESTTTTTTTTTEPSLSITIAAVGDVLMHESIFDSIKDEKTGSYDFRPIFAPVAPYLFGADYTVANLETCLAGAERGYSGYPLMNSPVSLAYGLKMSGIDLVTTANNHALDFGWEGLVSTLDALDRFGMAHVGSYRSMDEKKVPFIVDLQGIRVAFLNYTDWLNGLSPPEEHAGYAVNGLDVETVAEDAMIARMWGADIVIALLHWGDENERWPNEAQIEAARELRSRGVDVVLGAHPHVVQPIAHVFDFESWRVNDKYVAYSLGNFVSAQRLRYQDSGLIAYVHIEKTGLRASVTGISYLPVYVQYSAEPLPGTYRVLPVLPWSQPETDTVVTRDDKERMNQVWDELRSHVYRPDENIAPIVPADLGL